MQEAKLRQSDRKISFYPDKRHHSDVYTLSSAWQTKRLDLHSTELSSFLRFITFWL